MNGWILASERMPKDGETIMLYGMKKKYEVRGSAIYHKGKIAMSVGLIDKYRIDESDD